MFNKAKKNIPWNSVHYFDLISTIEYTSMTKDLIKLRFE